MNTEMKLSPREAWAFTVVSGLSLLNFLEQQLDDKELAVVIDGWLAWASSNVYPGDEKLADELIADLLNKYSRDCVIGGGARLRAQERLIEVLRERHV